MIEYTENQEGLLRQFEEDMVSTQLYFVDYAKDRLSFEQSYDEQKTQSHELHRFYCTAALLLCMTPLRKGLQPKSIVKSLGLWLGCCMFSSTFRDEMGSRIKQAVYPLVCAQAKTHGTDSVWERRRLQILASERGGYLPLTPESAAIMKVAFCKQAYQAMRKPGVDVAAIQLQYTDCEMALYRHARQDGVPEKEVDRAMRKLVGSMVDRDPDNARYFSELAYNDVVRENVQGPRSGDYVDVNGQFFAHSFTPRKPLSVNQLQKEHSAVWSGLMSGAHTPEDWFLSVTSADAQRMQRYFIHMECDDNDIPIPLYYKLRDACTSVIRDMDWMQDYGSMNPFAVAGMSMSYAKFMEHGPVAYQTQQQVRNPEFQVAFGRWLNDNPTYSPAYYQEEANRLYWAGNFDGHAMVREQIAYCLEQRDALLSLWESMFDKLNMQDTPVFCASASVEEKSASRMSMLQDVLGSYATDGLSDTMDDSCVSCSM